MGKRLQNKIALITGSAQGIGKACAQMFAEEGAYVFLSDVNDQLGVQAAKEIGGSYLHLDVQKEEDWNQAIKTILSKKGQLDILINNAGITGFQEGFGSQDPEHASLDSWRKVHAVNADGVFLGCKKAIEAMKNKGGAIVNVSSRSGLVGIPGAAAYASSKAAVRNHTKSVALYACEKGYNIRCNSVHPAAILTPLWDPMLGTGADREKALLNVAKGIPMKRLGTPEEAASAILFLASDEASYITGTELTIDGGILAGSSSSPHKE